MVGQWVSLKDYLVDGVRPTKANPPAVTGPLPSTWVSAWDYWVEGVRKPVEIPESVCVIPLRPPRKKKPAPPEVWLTVEDVLVDIQSVYGQSIVPLKVEEMRNANQQALDLGEISPEEWQYRDARLEEIQEEHLVRIEEIIHWYVDNYFREFGSDAQAEKVH